MNPSRTVFTHRPHAVRDIFVYALAFFLPALAARGANILAEDFTTLTDTAVPSGWTTSGSSDLDYTSSPYFGAASPSFKFKTNGQWLTSPSFDTGATGLQFWAYGNGGAGTFAVSGLVSGVWTLLETKSIAVNGAT